MFAPFRYWTGEVDSTGGVGADSGESSRSLIASAGAELKNDWEIDNSLAGEYERGSPIGSEGVAQAGSTDNQLKPFESENLLSMSQSDVPARSTGRRPNIIVLILDCARAKNYWFSGGTDIARTPNLQRLARQGAVFPKAVAPSNWTIPSHFSILTGLYPSAHGVRTFERPAVQPDMVSNSLQESGYETALFSENHLLNGFGLESGFSVCQAGGARDWDNEIGVAGRILGAADSISPGMLLKLVSKLPPLVAPISFVHRRQEIAYKAAVSSERTLLGFEDWMTKRDASRPFFVLMNWLDTHDPYEVVSDGEPVTLLERAYTYSPRMVLVAAPGIRARGKWGPIERGYIRSLEEADQKLGRLLAAIERVGEADRTILMVTADHGQAFGEGGSIYHGSGAADSVTRVPLVVAWPGGAAGPYRSERWVSLCELRGYIEALARGLSPSVALVGGEDGVRAPKLGAEIVYCEGAPPSEHLRSLQQLKGEHEWNHRLIAAYQGDRKIVLDCASSEVRVWTLDQDPDYTSPVILEREGARELRSAVFASYELQDAARAERARSGPPGTQVSVDRRLRSWGYD